MFYDTDDEMDGYGAFAVTNDEIHVPDEAVVADPDDSGDPEDLPDSRTPNEHYWDDVDMEKGSMPETRSDIDENLVAFYTHRAGPGFMSFMDNYQSEASIEANYRRLERQKVRDYKVKIRRKHEPDEATYMLYAKAAQTAGIITNVLPYSGQDILRRYLQSQLTCKKLFRRTFRWDEKLKELLSYDQRFCMACAQVQTNLKWSCFWLCCPMLRNSIFMACVPQRLHSSSWHLRITLKH